MIRPLRRRHRVMMVVLALTVPVLFAAGLLARRPMPQGVLPPTLSAPPFDSNDALGTQLKNTGSGLSLRISTLKPDGESDRRRVSIQMLRDPKRPELLVYWREGTGAASNVGDDSYLLGSLIGGEPVVFLLPETASSAQGSLIFYSLAQQEILDSVVLREPADAGAGR